MVSLLLMMSSWNFSFADSVTVPYNTSSNIWSNCIKIPYAANGSGYATTTNDLDIYIGIVGTNSSYTTYTVSDSPYNLVIRTGQTGSQSTFSATLQNGFYIVQGNYSGDTSSNSNVPIFSSLDDFISSLPYQSESDIRYPFTLQNGYLFVYDLGNSGSMYSFDLSSTSMEYSDIGSNPFPNTNQSYWFSNSLPEMDETSIPDLSTTIIHWDKGSNTNIFGQTQEMVATISGTSSGRYIYIYNPPVHYKWSGSSNPTASETINYPVIINGVTDSDNWYIYDSVARLTDFNQGGKVVGTVNSEPIIGSVTSSGSIVLTTSEGSIYVQSSGGSTDISGASGGSIIENINGIKQTLDDFVNQFIQLLSAPISHIQQLIQSGQNFFSFFTQLFDWLPSEVSGVIASALIVMIVIGVLKMLL